MSAHTIRISNTTTFSNLKNTIGSDCNLYSVTSMSQCTLDVEVTTNGVIHNETTIDFGEGLLGALFAFLTKIAIIRNRRNHSK